ncbi:hypothetical protein CFC21_048615 [Triticum aestivum]|uniref:Uncharacterized protein n=3 Tax=Triticum TaxID=4564 RepID=A0A9R1JP19_WHEAT|nr:hypothetical protein CFC21_036796 [Triticum aestivum]KAF7038428.1 hypothetical protein CFC21_048615 [Triticum aestivum]VAH65573.1 unnamed protein product [Triticum turgidum subsp. durum]
MPVPMTWLTKSARGEVSVRYPVLKSDMKSEAVETTDETTPQMTRLPTTPPLPYPIHDANSRITSLLYCAAKLVSATPVP